jgi:Ca2+-binding RTX toxin-like protein
VIEIPLKESVMNRNARNVLPRATRNVPCVLEAVEQRRLMSTVLAGGWLRINGTPGDDRITVELASNKQLKVTDNGVVKHFKRSAVLRIVASLGAGHDGYTSSPNVTQPQRISGGAGHDVLVGGKGDDSIFGEDGQDQIRGRDGADWISGGADQDEVSYTGARGKVSVSLDNKPNDGLCSSWMYSTEFDNVQIDVEIVRGGDHDDYLSGSGWDNMLFGNGGHDHIRGNGGNDRLFGSAGMDTLLGQGGNDALWGEMDSDILNGGAGTDDVCYDEVTIQNTRPYGVHVQLPEPGKVSSGNGNNFSGENDSIIDVENVTGTQQNDLLLGNSGDNVVSGMGGGDDVRGGAGNDRVYGGNGDDLCWGDDGNDFVWGEQGNDLLRGGPGWDDVRYDDSYHQALNVGVQAKLADYNGGLPPFNSGNGNRGESDTIMEDFEALIGTRLDDTLFGNSSNNYIAGLEGNDFLSAGGGDDTLDPGKGTDYAFGDSGNDTLFGKDGDTSDTLHGGDGWDTLERDVARFSITLFGVPKRDTVLAGEVVR